MKLGVDFGTTRIVVAASDRGNYPLAPFENGEDTAEWFPPLVAIRGEEHRYGWAAWNTQGEPGWTLVRSLKRYLEDSGPDTRLDVGGRLVPIATLLEGLVRSLQCALHARYGAHEKFEVMLGVPANANSNQRFMTVEAFRRAGFSVVGLLNEPSAASIEFGHRNKTTASASVGASGGTTGAARRVLVYDLGGGTFDVSLVDLAASGHTVLATEGIANLGGDDFDQVLAEMAVGAEVWADLDAGELFHLLEECRRHKEALHANSRRMTIDLEGVREGLGQATVVVADYYARCRPLVDRTVAATARLAEAASAGASGGIDALYVTGGGSELPLVARALREEFGRKVKRSEYTRSATAIGLAIQADATTGYALREVFTRNFGVWREGESGQRMVFDTVFPAGTRLPAPGEEPLVVVRTYRPAHNIGHFRYLEASALRADEGASAGANGTNGVNLGNVASGTNVTAAGQPSGDITVWDEILFPLDPALAEVRALEGLPVERRGETDPQRIEERYFCDATGSVTVKIQNLTAHYGREYRLGRWSPKAAVAQPAGRPVVKKRALAAAQGGSGVPGGPPSRAN